MTEEDEDLAVVLIFEDFTDPIITRNPKFSKDQLLTLFDTFCTFKDRNSEYLNLERLQMCMDLFKEDGKKEIKMKLLEEMGTKYPKGVLFPDFVAFLTTALADLSDQRNRQIWFNLVADENGHLTGEQLYNLCKECNITSNQKECETIVLKMGGQGDGFVTQDEFEKFESIIERWKARHAE